MLNKPISHPAKTAEFPLFWLMRACAIPFFLAGLMYLFLVLGSLVSVFTNPVILQAMRYQYFLVMMAGTGLVFTLLAGSLRLLLMRRWACIALAAIAWFGTLAMLRTFSLSEPNFGVLLPVSTLAIILTGTLIFQWQQLKSGF